MHLTKLELHGFKSFADETALVFEAGVTAIVGPNGCGKSNVSDAVRWVLGEQRARMLRGAKMEEVIFQGSSARRAVNVAEVSLHFDNEDGTLPVPYKEVVITRRLSRSGDSEYLLNRTPCRLRDIHDMMRGTGLGSDSGIVIESRMIDALLSDRPDDRRELFEEAAGVGLYRDRKRSAERRLEETSADLARIDDLIGEVQSQVRSLARQRKRAERNVELTSRRFGVELTLASREMHAWHEELRSLDERLTTLRAAVPGGEEAVIQSELARDFAHEGRSVSEAARNELARLAAEQQQSVQQLRGEIAVAEERQRNALQRRQRAEEERREGQAFGERLSADRARAAAEKAELEGELEGVVSELQLRAGDEESARAAVTEARSTLEQAERTARELRDQVRRLEMDRESAQRETTEVSHRATALESELEQLSNAVVAVMREISTADEGIELARMALSWATNALETARATAREARDRDATARAELARAEELHTSLEAKANALEALERDRVGLAPAAARLLTERERFGEGAVLGPLSDFVSTNASSAILVERFLGMTVHAVVVRDSAVADAVRAWHQSANPGPLLLLPLDAMSQDGGPNDTEAILAGVEAAAPAAGWVRSLLARVRPLDEGAAFVDARGAVWLPGAIGGPGPLRRRAELFALRAELATGTKARAIAARNAEEARVALGDADREVSTENEAMSVAQLEARRANEQRAELERRRLRAIREVEEAQALSERLTSRAQQLAERIASLDVRVQEVLVDADAGEAETGALRERMTEAERAQDIAREHRSAAQVRQAQAHARLQVASDRVRRLHEEQQTAEQRISSLQQELSTLDVADRQLHEQMADWQLDLQGRVSMLADAQGRLTAAQQQVRDADIALSDAEHALDAARRHSRALGDELHHAELRFTELSGRRAAIKERLETEWRRPLDELFGSFEPVDVDDVTLRAEAEALRAELERLGPVNPLAVEEHEEEARRLEFLTSQRTDLSDALRTLQTIIRETDSVARELFLGMFAQVRENFRQIFMTLFGGGECDIRLENPDAPLDCDIEIHASPRGKRTQRIHLLSSGERALVALSLLFGIFLTKPNPFCLLDEVDAPLDDANIGRFVHMLNQFKSKTQFIVITHNPRTTTEAADAVYGVTMQEPGVSSLVSVRMRGTQIDESVVDEQGAVNEVAVSA